MKLVPSTPRPHMPAGIRHKLGSAFYLLQYCFDRLFRHRTPISRPPQMSELQLPAKPIGPSRFPRRVCKVCDESDWFGEEWLQYLDELGVGEMRARKHRKGWEWAQGLYALQHLGLLRPDAVGLGIGVGTEPFAFCLTNRIKMVYATDIYGRGQFAEETAFADMITAPERYSKIPFDPNRLIVLAMDGCNLRFLDDSFDLVFSFSAIEHFGGHERAHCAMQEMARVVKPSGAVIVTTEVVLNGMHHGEYFLPEQLIECCVRDTGLQLIEDIDFQVSPETLVHALDCRNPSYRTAHPHVILKFGKVCWTSICLALVKKPAGTRANLEGMQWGLDGIAVDAENATRSALRSGPGGDLLPL